MSRIQQWVAGTVVLVIVIFAAGWFTLISPQKHHAAKYRAQASQQELTNDGLRGRVATLRALQKNVPGDVARIAAIVQEVPTNPGLPDYVRTLSSTATATGVELVSIAPGAGTPVAAPTAAAAPAAAATDTATSDTSTATTAPAAAAAPATQALQAIPIALDVRGGYFQIQQFVAAVEKLNRATLVDSIDLHPGSLITSTGQASGSASPSASPSASAPVQPAWETIDASIAITIFMNSTETFAVTVPTSTPAPSASSASGATTAPVASPSPSASASQ